MAASTWATSRDAGLRIEDSCQSNTVLPQARTNGGSDGRRQLDFWHSCRLKFWSQASSLTVPPSAHVSRAVNGMWRCSFCP